MTKPKIWQNCVNFPHKCFRESKNVPLLRWWWWQVFPIMFLHLLFKLICSFSCHFPVLHGERKREIIQGLGLVKVADKKYKDKYISMFTSRQHLKEKTLNENYPFSFLIYEKTISITAVTWEDYRKVNLDLKQSGMTIVFSTT